jgi:hypothetical protein
MRVAAVFVTQLKQLKETSNLYLLLKVMKTLLECPIQISGIWLTNCYSAVYLQKSIDQTFWLLLKIVLYLNCTKLNTIPSDNDEPVPQFVIIV